MDRVKMVRWEVKEGAGPWAISPVLADTRSRTYHQRCPYEAYAQFVIVYRQTFSQSKSRAFMTSLKS